MVKTNEERGGTCGGREVQVPTAVLGAEVFYARLRIEASILCLKRSSHLIRTWRTFLRRNLAAGLHNGYAGVVQIWSGTGRAIANRESLPSDPLLADINSTLFPVAGYAM